MINKLVAIFLLLVVFLPLKLIFGEIKGFKWTTTPYVWLLSITITVSIALLLNAIFPRVVNSVINKCTNSFNYILRVLPKFGFLILGITLTYISVFAFSNSPLLIDSIVQLFQAEIFASGSLTATRPEFMEFFVTQHTIFDSSGWYGQYPPGHSLLLVPGVLIHYPWIVPILLSISSAYITYSFCKNIFNERTASLTLLLFCVSPFFLFMGASYMNHVTSLLLSALLIFNFERWESTGSFKNILLLAFFAGIQILVRPLDLVAISIVFILPSIRLYLKQPKHLLPTLLGSFPAIGFGLYYNKETTGGYFLPGYIKLWGASHGLGFHNSPWGHLHTPTTGLRNELVDLQLVQEMLFEGSIPALYIIAIYLLFEKRLEIWPKRLLVIGLSFPFMYFFYWHRDSFLGPRFMYSAIVAWIPLTAFSIKRLYEKIGDHKTRVLKLFNFFYLKNFLTVLILISFLFTFFVNFPSRFYSYSSSLSSLKTDIFKETSKNGIDSGLIFIKTSWGVRIISRFRGKGLSASLVQKAYTFLDHCYLHELLEKSDLEGLRSEKLEEILVRELDKKILTKIYNYNYDPSLSFDPNRKLTNSCVEEINYDLKNGQINYTVYEPYMRANNPKLIGPFIFVKDLRASNIKLVKKYPALKPILFDGEKFSALIY